MIRSFAEAAILHASERHRQSLGWRQDAIPLADRVLDAERETGDSGEHPSIALCYGSWFGELINRQWQGNWIGLHESVPPRVMVQGRPCSPIDAVAARLRGAQAATLGELWREVEQWVKAHQSLARSAPQTNRQAWEDLAEDNRFRIAAEEFSAVPDRESALDAIDPWLRELAHPGKKLLLLAAGGGTHSLIYAAAGFAVTVVDASPRMLAVDQRLASQFRLRIDVRHASLQDLSCIPEAHFDAVVQPVSSCYISDVHSMYRQVARVVRSGGLYAAQHKQPASLQASGSGEDPFQLRHPLFEGQSVQRVFESDEHLESGTIEFIHSLESLLGGLCHAGFIIEDVTEPPRGDAWAQPGTAAQRACYLPPYLKLKARRR